MKTQDLIDELSMHGMKVFTVAQAARAARKPTRYISKLLAASKRVARVERGIYCITGINGASMYEIASSIAYPSYISMFAAFQYHGLTAQGVVRYTVIALKRHKEVEFGGAAIEFLTLGRKRFFGYRRDGMVFVATPEKAIVDALYFGRPEYSYIGEALERALKDKLLDVYKLKEYAIRMQARTLLNKLGFLLERYGADAGGLEAGRSKNIVSLSRNGRRIDKKWSVAYD